jgi:hypothetical protein
MIKQLFWAGLLCTLVHIATAGFGQEEKGWWPVQESPDAIVTCTVKRASDAREMNLAQSVAGLVALALNEGTTKEGVWLSTVNPDYAGYYTSLVKRLHAKEPGKYPVWDLVERYRKQGLIKGYILYDYNSRDNSVNLATVYAGLKKGVLVDITQEAAAQKKGLTRLYDARGKVFTEALFTTLKQELNPHLLVLGNPAFSNNRDYAIAHKSMVYYGVDSFFTTVLQWVQPLSPVIGWNKGDEFKHIEPCTRWGLINTASDWCMNLSLLSVPATQEPAKIRSLDPGSINWKEAENYHSFVMSDGDNMQWTFGGFLNSTDYWSNPYTTRIPMSFTSCVLNLSQAGADVYDRLVQSQPAGVSVVEYGGGYYYPDLFAKARPTPEKWLRAYAAMINVQMKKTGAKVFGFLCKNVASAAAQAAYRIFAEEIEDLTGMIAVQYSPYNGGAGATWWVKNKKGIEIPVVSAKYQLWANLPKKGSGDPAAVAGWINADNTNASSENRQLNWTIVHAWSQFADKENKAQERGVTPVELTKEMIEPGTKIVSIEELLWRLRMQHNAAVTRALIGTNL